MSVKAELRAKYKSLRESLSPEEKAFLDLGITENILNLNAYKQAETVFVFISKDIEVNTSAVIKDALDCGKRVAAPRCDDDKNMSFYFIRSYDDLSAGAFGVREPNPDKCEKAGCKADMILVPGLVYDESGFRVGFGKGYYDRFLKGFEGLSVGVCYSECVVEKIMSDKYDLSVDLLVTEKSVTYTKSN